MWRSNTGTDGRRYCMLRYLRPDSRHIPSGLALSSVSSAADAAPVHRWRLSCIDLFIQPRLHFFFRSMKHFRLMTNEATLMKALLFLRSDYRWWQIVILLLNSFIGMIFKECIAYLCGFTDASYFNRCFRKKYGVTPTEYVMFS